MLRFLISLILLMFIHPVLAGTAWEDIIFRIGIAAVMLLGIAAVSQTKKTLYAGLSLASVTALLGFGVSFADLGFKFQVAQLICVFILFCYTAVVIVYKILRARSVDANMIYGVISAYILIGVAGAMVFSVLEIIHPGSFSQAVQPDDAGPFVYFSFVTLSTLGYGDMVPVSPIAQTISIFLSLLGQLYLTVVVALIVGKYIAESKEL